MTQPNNLLEAALAYADMGWHIFPCGPKSKIPLISKKRGGKGVRDATTDKDQIKAWWSKCPNANIALACGPDSGVYVVDVDFEEGGEENGWETLRNLKEKDNLQLPESVRQNTPRGGAHYLYKTDKPPSNRNKFAPGSCPSGNTGIDIRCDGYYIMLSPSVHPNGKKYEWTGKHAPGEFELAEFPDFMRPELKKEKRTPVAPWEQQKTVKKVKTTPDKSNVLERARLYIATCDPAIQGSGGHDALLRAANVLICGFDLSESNAVEILWSDFNTRCIPPWDRGKASDVKDFERKVKEAKRTNDKPIGWLLNEDNMAPELYDEKLLNLGNKIATKLLNEHGKIPVDLSTFELDNPGPIGKKKYVTRSVIASLDEDAIPDFMRKMAEKVSDIPEKLLHPPGFVGALCDWINETAGCYQPFLTVGAAITAAGALFGRKVKDQSNGRTNVYTMGVAHSSAGKDHPADCIEQLFARGGASDLLGGSRVTSDSAIEVGLTRNPVQLFHWDEVGHMFASIKSSGGGGGGSSYLQTVIPCLMQLFSSAHKIFLGKQKADESRREIDQPHVCIWSLTSPDVLYRGLTTEQLKDGWLGRVITFISHSRPKYKMTEHTPPPAHLVDFVKSWVGREIEPIEDIGNLEGLSCHQMLVPTDKLALKVFDDYYNKFYSRMLKCGKEDDDTQYLWGKALENARRVALILAAGQRYEDPVITEEIAIYSCELIEYTVRTFADAVRYNVASTQCEADKLKIINVCRKAGDAGVTKSIITRKTQGIRDKRTRDAYIADLIEAEVLDCLFDDETKKVKYWLHPLGLKYQQKMRKG